MSSARRGSTLEQASGLLNKSAKSEEDNNFPKE